MAHIHPKDAKGSPKKPFEGEEAGAKDAAATLKEQRKESGNLPDSSKEAPVQNDRPYKNLKG